MTDEHPNPCCQSASIFGSKKRASTTPPCSRTSDSPSPRPSYQVFTCGSSTEVAISPSSFRRTEDAPAASHQSCGNVAVKLFILRATQLLEAGWTLLSVGKRTPLSRG